LAGWLLLQFTDFRGVSLSFTHCIKWWSPAHFTHLGGRWQSFFVCEKRLQLVHWRIFFVDFLDSTSAIQFNSLFKEHISLAYLDSWTVAIGIYRTVLKTVTEFILNYKSVRALHMDPSEIDTVRFLIIIESYFSVGNW